VGLAFRDVSLHSSSTLQKWLAEAAGTQA
jgi:hypothetical protein